MAKWISAKTSHRVHAESMDWLGIVGECKLLKVQCLGEEAIALHSMYELAWFYFQFLNTRPQV